MIVLPSATIDLVANSTPIVLFDSRLNSFRVKRDNRFDFPTPESPISTTARNESHRKAREAMRARLTFEQVVVFLIGLRHVARWGYILRKEKQRQRGGRVMHAPSVRIRTRRSSAPQQSRALSSCRGAGLRGFSGVGRAHGPLTCRAFEVGLLRKGKKLKDSVHFFRTRVIRAG